MLAPASDETALWLQAIWMKLLRLDILPSLETSFFELGGDLLAAAELIAAVEEKFCCELPLQPFLRFQRWQRYVSCCETRGARQARMQYAASRKHGCFE